jgi:hypothetical protein
MCLLAALAAHVVTSLCVDGAAAGGEDGPQGGPQVTTAAEGGGLDYVKRILTAVWAGR